MVDREEAGGVPSLDAINRDLGSQPQRYLADPVAMVVEEFGAEPEIVCV